MTLEKRIRFYKIALDIFTGKISSITPDIAKTYGFMNSSDRSNPHVQHYGFCNIYSYLTNEGVTNIEEKLPELAPYKPDKLYNFENKLSKTGCYWFPIKCQEGKDARIKSVN